LVRIRVSRGAGGKGDRRWEEEENKEILYMDLEGLKPLALSGDVIKKMNAKGKRNCPKVGLIRAEKEGAHGDQKDQ
jgi:hypothetical protein